MVASVIYFDVQGKLFVKRVICRIGNIRILPKNLIEMLGSKILDA